MGVKLLSRSFAAGEITPEMADRPDLGQYQTGLAKCINGIIYPHGPVQKRGGTEFVARAKYWWEGDAEPNYTRQCALIPFQFSATQSYMLEVGHQYIRFHTDGSTLLEGVNIQGEMIRSEGVESGTPNRIAIHKKRHGLLAGKKIRITATASTKTGTNVGTVDASVSAPLPMLGSPGDNPPGIAKNDYWEVTTGGNALLGRQANAGYLLRAKQDDPYEVATSAIGNFSGTTFTDTDHGTGNYSVGHYLYGTGIPAGTYITALGTGTGANDGGTYTINNSVTAGPITVTGWKEDPDLWEFVPVENWTQFDGTVDYTVEDPDTGPDPDMFLIDVDSTLTAATPPVKTFTKITRAKEAVVYAPAHGFSNGDLVIFGPLTNKNPSKVHFVYEGKQYKVSDAATDTFKIKHLIDVDEDGTTEWVYLDTKKDFRNNILPKGYVGTTEVVSDYDTADVQYTVVREVTCEGDEYFVQNSHGFYTGQTVWLDAANVSPFLKSAYYQVDYYDDNTFRLYEIDGSQVIGPGGPGSPASAGFVYPVYEVETDYDESDVGMLDWSQSFDVITFAHKSYRPASLTRYGASDWLLEDEVFIPTIDAPSNMLATVTGSGGSVRPIYYAITAIEDDDESLPAYVERPALDVSKLAARITYNIVPYWSGNGYYSDPVSSNTTTGPAIKLASGTLNLNQQIRLEAGDAMSDEFIAAIEGDGMNDNLYRVIAVLKSGWYVLSRRSKNPVNWIAYEGDIEAGSIGVYRFGSVNADFDAGYKVALSWKAKPNVSYNVYKKIGGSGGDPLGFIGHSENGFFTDDGITPDMSLTTPGGEDPFEKPGNYPACVDYFAQRKVFAGTDTRPQNVWMTKLATERNMLQSIPVRDTDSIHFRMAGREQNSIKFMSALQDLILFTENGEWKVGATNGNVVTPSTIMVAQQSNIGCADVKPALYNNSILFVQSGSNRVMRLGYDWNSQSYSSEDISMMSFHLFENRSIVSMAIERGTFPVLWCVRDDGIMLGLTYVPEQNVVSWWRAELDGEIISARSIKDNGTPMLYMVIRRTVGESDERVLIERMDNYTHWLSRTYMDCVTTVTITEEEMAAAYGGGE